MRKFRTERCDFTKKSWVSTPFWLKLDLCYLYDEKTENEPKSCKLTVSESGSHKIIDDFKIQIEYYAGGKSGSLIYNPSINKLSKTFKFKSECKYDERNLDYENFSDTFHTYYYESWTSGQREFVECDVKINVTYKVTFELELKTIEMPSRPKLLHKLYSEGEFSDIKIFCDGKVFNCHKIILSRQSEVFEKMLDVENDMKEATTGKIEITDISASTMENLLFFIYHEYLYDDEAKVEKI